MPTSDIKKGPLYVDSTNNSVGIGTTTNNQSSSTASVTLNAASGMSAYELRNADVFSGYVGNTGTNMYLVNAKNGSLGLYTNNTERMHLTSTGKVGIGNASPATALDLGTTLGAKLTLYPTNYSIGVESNELRIASNAVTSFYSGGHSGTERMRITADGLVGIGTSSPSRLLEVNGSAAFINIDSGANNNQRGIEFDYGGSQINGSLINFGGTGETALSGGESGSSGYFLTFKTNGSERMRIDSSGAVLVASTSPNDMWRGLGQDGTHIGSNYCASQYGSNNNLYMSKPSGYTDGTYVSFFVNGSGVGNITTNGSSTSYNTGSDYRLKENVVADWDATTRLKQLNPVRFNFIADADTTVDGFLAHEVQTVVPEAISGTHNEVDDEGNPVYQGIDQSKLVPLLVKTIQELEARITALENA
jgi:hypothetical protein